MVVRSNEGTALAYGLVDDDCGDWTLVERRRRRSHCSCDIDVLSGGGWNVQLSSRLLGAAYEFSDWHCSGGFNWVDQFNRQSRGLRGPIHSRLLEQGDELFYRRRALSVCIGPGGSLLYS